MGLDTLSNVKSRLGISTTDYDTFLQQQIDTLSDVIEAYCGRKFKAANWIQTFYKSDRKDAFKLTTYLYPVIEVTDLTVDDDTIDPDDLRIHKPTGIIKRLDGGSLYGGEVVLSYRAGYETVPSPVLDVLDSLVNQRYNKKKSGVDLDFGNDIQRISIPGAISIDFDFTLSNNDRTSAYGTIIGSFANVLDHWRSESAVIPIGSLEYVEEDT